jgi:hypothetical protein
MTAPAPTLRITRPPAVDPPYDDELTDAAPLVVGSLALAFPTGPDLVPLRLVPPACALGADPDTDSRSTSRAELPDPRSWTGRVAQAVVEVLAGARSAAQLSRFATLDVLQQLERATGRLAGRPGAPVARPVVASVHVDEPADGVAEACIVVDTGRRRRAMAMRIEGLDGRWQCTAFQFG